VRLPYQRYLLHELAADIYSGHNVRSTVFIETSSMYRPDGPEELRPVGEIEFVQGLAAASASGLYGPARAAAAIVGRANLNLGEEVKPVLEALQAASPNRFRGIRQSAAWDSDPKVEDRAPKGQLADSNFRTGAQTLAQMGLSLDITLYFPQLPELADFANAVPELTIVLNHIGGLLRTGPYGDRDDDVLPVWKSGISAVAKCPNVNVKLGGVGQPRYGFDWYALAGAGAESLFRGIGIEATSQRLPLLWTHARQKALVHHLRAQSQTLSKIGLGHRNYFMEAKKSTLHAEKLGFVST